MRRPIAAACCEQIVLTMASPCRARERIDSDTRAIVLGAMDSDAKVAEESSNLAM